jgi:hypothetical protein
MGIFSGNDDHEKADRDRWDQLAPIADAAVRNFQKLGKILAEIRDKQLYRFEHGTFAQCCEQRWKISERHACRMIDAAAFCDELGPAGQVPATERQFRALKMLPAEERIEAWNEAQANGGTPVAIATAIAKRKPRVKKSGALKPLRLKVPGGSVVITPNRRGNDYGELLHHALAMIGQRAAA